MWVERETLLIGTALLVQVLGLIGVVAARLCQRWAGSWWSVTIPVLCVLVVGAVSLGTMETCERGWLVFATTLPLMAVGATIDLRKSPVRTAF